ncbi:hypothetical protein Tco_0985224 [Tanacetum coccineum]
MLNKGNYVPWSSRLLRYAKSRPNGKLIYNSIMNSSYVRRMIPELGDTNREVLVNETFHEQTYDELAEKELKQVEVDDQAIQTILLGLLEDIFAAIESCEIAQEIRLCVQQMMKGFDIGIQEKKVKLWLEEMVGISLDYDGQNIGNQNGYNELQNVKNQVVQNAVRNPGVQNVGNQNGLIVVPGIANQNPNRNSNVVAARAEGNANGNNGNQKRCYNYRGLGHLARNCIVRPMRRDDAYLQTLLLNAQKEEAGIQLQAEEFNLMAAAAILMNSMNVEQGGGTVEQHPATVEETHAYFESLYNNLAIKVEKVNTVNRKLRETNADLPNELARYKNQEKCFEISQEKYDNLKEKSIVSSLEEEKKKLKSDFKIREDELLDKQIQLENKIKELDNILVSEHKDTTHGTSANTKFEKQSILGKPPSSSRPKLYAVTPLPKSKDIPKAGESNALSKQVTSNSVPSSQESKVVKNERVIPFKDSKGRQLMLST